MKCIERLEVPSPSGPRVVSWDGGVLGHVDGDPEPTAEHFWVRSAGDVGKPDILRKFERYL